VLRNKRKNAITKTTGSDLCSAVCRPDKDTQEGPESTVELLSRQAKQEIIMLNYVERPEHETSWLIGIGHA